MNFGLMQRKIDAAAAALDFLPAVKDWIAEAATRPGISGRRDGARLDEGGLWPTAPLVRRGLGQREPAVAAAHRPPQAACAPRCCTGRPGGGPGVGLGWGRALDRRGYLPC